MPDVFDQHADNYSDRINESLSKFGAKHDFFAVHKAKLLARLLRRHGLRALDCRLVDVGCGTGMLHAYVTGQFASVDGVDPSRESIRVATETYPMNRYSDFTGGRLPYDDKSFDIALAAAVFHHVVPAERMMLAQEMLRILRPDGLAIVIEHNPFNPVTRHIVNTCELDKDAILLRPTELRGIFTLAGGQSVYTRTVLSVPPINELMLKVDDLLGYLPFGAQYYLVAHAASSP